MHNVRVHIERIEYAYSSSAQSTRVHTKRVRFACSSGALNMCEHTTYSECVRVSINRTECGRAHPCARAHQAHEVCACTSSAQRADANQAPRLKVCAHIKRAKCTCISTSHSARTLQVRILVKRVSTYIPNAYTHQTCYSSSAQHTCAHQVHKARTCTTSVRSALHQMHGTCASISSARGARVHVKCARCARAHPVHRRYTCHSSAGTHPPISQQLGPGSGSVRPLDHVYH